MTTIDNDAHKGTPTVSTPAPPIHRNPPTPRRRGRVLRARRRRPGFRKPVRHRAEHPLARGEAPVAREARARHREDRGEVPCRQLRRRARPLQTARDGEGVRIDAHLCQVRWRCPAIVRPGLLTALGPDVKDRDASVVLRERAG